MTKQDIMNKFVSLRREMDSVPSMLEFIQNTDVSVDDLLANFPAANVMDAFVKMANECSQQW